MSQSDLPPPVRSTIYHLRDDGPLVPLIPDVQHPNGSEGWLPVAEPVKLPPQAPHQRDLTPQRARTPPFPFPVPIPITDTEKPREAERAPSLHGSATTPHTRRATTANTAPSQKYATSLGRSGSRRSVHTTKEGKELPGGAFVGGAGVTGPSSTAHMDEELTERRTEANNQLTPKQRSKIIKGEEKDGRRLSKIIKNEAKTEKQALALAMDELDELQKFQKNTIKSEGRVRANHSKLLVAFKKNEAAYLNAKMRYETSQAELNAEADALQTLKSNARQATEQMTDKAAEIDSIRKTLAMDERERELKLSQLKGRNLATPGTGGATWRN